MRHLVAYDVGGNTARERVAARLQQDGLRLQRSVFQVDVLDAAALLRDLATYVDLDADVIQMFRQCRSCEQSQASIGQYGPVLQERWWVA